jgi:inorganic pyrophosphatase
MVRDKTTSVAWAALPARNEDEGTLNVVIDTPQGSRNKFKFDETHSLFKLAGVLPVGAVFPFDFGFIPATRGGDGDPLDVLVLMDAPAFVGCLIEARLIGVIEAEQTEDGKTERNDRLIAVTVAARLHRDVQSLDELNERLLDEIEHFFVSYNAAKGKQFKPLGRAGPARANEVLAAGLNCAATQTAKEPYKMSDKDRQKKDGQDKNKKTLARSAAEVRPEVKRTRSAQTHAAADVPTRTDEQANRATERTAPAAARAAAASKANKGK